VQLVPVTNEGEGLAICAGAWLTGRRSALIMENSGLLLAGHQLETICTKYEIPVLLLVSFRGHVGDGVWWLEPLGERVEQFLTTMDVRYTVVSRVEEVKAAVRDALVTAEVAKYPVAVLVRRGGVRPRDGSDVCRRSGRCWRTRSSSRTWAPRAPSGSSCGPATPTSTRPGWETSCP